jgi:alkylation response protein AidB-like acyl-CoA dehydrogenase
MMDLSYSDAYVIFRSEVRSFLEEHWAAQSGADNNQFRHLATERGYLYRQIPRRYGGSEQAPDVLKAQIVREEFARVGAPTEVPGNGVMMLVPTLLQCGAQWQCETFISKTLTGEYLWAQGYSEPASGSDLASVRTKGVLSGSHWIINGQKIWTTRAHRCRFMFMLVRTEPEAPKHQGLSYLLLDLKQPGVIVRPLKQLTGDTEFCEVFFTDAETPAEWIVGERGEGWQVSRTTLKAERSFIGGAEQSVTLFAKLVKLAQRRQRDGKRLADDPAVRDRLAVLEGYVLAHQYSSLRQLSMAARDQDPGIITLMNKLIRTNIGHEAALIAADLIAEDLLLAPPSSAAWPTSGDEKWVNHFLGSLGIAIAGGTSNVQLNIIAERGLGLPRTRNIDTVP